MAESEFDELKTRHSLLARLHDWQDDQSWQEFFEKYWRLIYNLAVRAGRRLHHGHTFHLEYAVRQRGGSGNRHGRSVRRHHGRARTG